MVELARALQSKSLVQLGEVAKITGISSNYLAQLAMPLRNGGLLMGVSGKKGGYTLGRPADEIYISEILEAVQGPIALTDCSDNPELCLYAPFCETRMLWVIAGHKLKETFGQYTLADLIKKNFCDKTRRKYKEIDLLKPEEQERGNPGPLSCAVPPDSQ